MKKRYAVVDLEATDAHSTQNKIIQIGIIFVENGQIVNQFSQNVNPHENLQPRIAELTGLSNEILANSPDFSEVAEKVYKMLSNCVFVAHNAQFDYKLLQKELSFSGFDLDLERLDTVDLARVFYPTMERYSLEYLSQELQLNHENPHEALSDSFATAELLMQIEQKARKLPRAVMEEILRHSESLLYESAHFLREILPDCKLISDELQIVANIATKIQVKSDGNEKLAVKFDENISKLNLENRQIQHDFAAAITADLERSEPSFIEAGTGIGKTFGYLLPLLAAGKNVIVSTPAKVLQAQLMNDVGRKLNQIFGISFAQLVGTKNYISLEKFSKLLQNNTEGKNFEIFKMKILVWLTETESGILDELSRHLATDEDFSAVSHDGISRKSQLHFEQDFWNNAQQFAKKAQVKVVNHAYLIERLADEADSFLTNSVLVVDEAQQLFPIMEKNGSRRIALQPLFDTIDTENRLQKRLLESLKHELSQKNLNRDKLRMDCSELGFDQLLPLFDQDFLWLENDELCASNLNFYNFKRLIPDETKLYMLGSTLALNKENHVLPELLGFDAYHFVKFDQKQRENQELLILSDGPHVKNVNAVHYAEYLAEKISAIAELNKPIVVLFTSKISLTFTAEQLSHQGWNVLAQDISGTATQIKKKFDKGEAQILLGLGSFWEGIDFAKQNELILVIPRLPFATPDDILTKKYANRFPNPFYDFNVPMATLKLEQAFGRVNRRPTQKSLVVILDNRLAGKSYGKRMRRLLDERLPVQAVKSDELYSEILQYFD